jgi:hypothetical protein
MFLSVHANVFLYAPKTFLQGEGIVFTIEAQGDSDIEFPKIERIDGFAVQEAGSSNSYSSVNGKVSRKISKQYQFFPTRSVTLPKFEVKIDGKSFYTNIYNIKQQKATKTQSNLFDLTIGASKTEALVGESIIYTIKFKYDQNARIEKMGLNLPSFKHFWSKKIKETRQYQEGNFIVQELDFLLFAQRSGKMNLDAISIDMLVSDSKSDPFSFFNNRLKKMRIFSNDLKINIKPLPQNIALIGDFQIQATVDKNTLTLGESLSYKIEVKGKGNIDDVPEFKLSLADVTVYENKPVLKTTIKNNEYEGVWSKSFSLIPSKNIVIPSMSLEYFNAQSGTIESLKTKAFNIHVLGSKKTTEVHLEKAHEKVAKSEPATINRNSVKDRIIFFVLGGINAVLMVGLYTWVINRKSRKTINEQPLIKRVKQSKTKEALIKVLLPFVHVDVQLKEKIEMLEDAQNEFKPLKKEILSLIETKRIKDI